MKTAVLLLVVVVLLLLSFLHSAQEIKTWIHGRVLTLSIVVVGLLHSVLMLIRNMLMAVVVVVVVNPGPGGKPSKTLNITTHKTTNRI